MIRVDPETMVLEITVNVMIFDEDAKDYMIWPHKPDRDHHNHYMRVAVPMHGVTIIFHVFNVKAKQSQITTKQHYYSLLKPIAKDVINEYRRAN